MAPDLSSPWREFLEELDGLLGEPIDLHCIGGFAVVAAYGLPRSTNDLDYFTMEPCDYARELQGLAGEGSPLARKHKVHVHHAGVATVPESYQERRTAPPPTTNWRSFVCLAAANPVKRSIIRIEQFPAMSEVSSYSWG